MASLLDAAAALLTCIGVALCFLGLAAVLRFSWQSRAEDGGVPHARPPVTILKPLCGNEPLLEQALESAFRQAYPDFQIVFGIQDPADPALAVVDGLRSRFPDCDIRVVVDSTLHGANRKVSNLINMLPFASHEILVISDSDLHLPPSYLDRLLQELEKPGTGLVTSLFIGLPSIRKRWAARLGATQISHYFLPGVLMSRAMGRADCLGSTAMFRRETLERTGGFQALVHLLAEDNVLGRRVRDLGLSIRLAGIVPAAAVPEPTLMSLWRHEMRWTRTIREVAPLSLGASAMQYPLFWAVLYMMLSGGAAWSIAAFFASWGVRAGSAWAVDRALRRCIGRRAPATPFWLLPLRDIVSVAEIAASFWINEVTWRGHKIGVGSAVTPPPVVLSPAFEPESLLQEN